MKSRMIAMLSTFTLLTAAAALAQDHGWMKATIPFEFHAGGKVLPAGVYNVRYESGMGAMSIRGVNGGLFLRANPHESKKAPERSSLVFNQYNQTYFLSEIKTAGVVLGWQLSKPKVERELALNGAQAPPVEVALTRP